MTAKTTTPKPLPKTERKWYLVDAEGKTLGHLSTRIADILRGKNKPTFTPHLDMGDYVVVINADKIKVTGRKEEQKEYFRHSGYLGNLKRIPLGKVRQTFPVRILEHSVAGMIPRNRLKNFILSKFYVYAGEDHPHAGQNPEILAL
jgi:large subunit ribosomal protein L13